MAEVPLPSLSICYGWGLAILVISDNGRSLEDPLAQPPQDNKVTISLAEEAEGTTRLGFV
jgi:hypothetical protein